MVPASPRTMPGSGPNLRPLFLMFLTWAARTVRLMARARTKCALSHTYCLADGHRQHRAKRGSGQPQCRHRTLFDDVNEHSADGGACDDGEEGLTDARPEAAGTPMSLVQEAHALWT